VSRAGLVCGRVGDDGDGMAAQLVRPALRLLSGPATCMATSCCICMAWGIVPPRVSMVVLVPWARAAWKGPHTSRSRGRSCEAETSRARRILLVQGGDLSYEAETSRTRERLLGGIPREGNWSEMFPTGRRLDVLPVWVLPGVLSLPCLESWP
jgi:hypothetical protein